MNSGETSCFDRQNVGLIVGMRPDFAQGKFEFSVGFFQQILTVIHWDFQQFFSEISGLNSEKVAAILCARLHENHRFTTTTQKNEGTALNPPCSGGSHKGASPLDPHHPPQTDVL